MKRQSEILVGCKVQQASIISGAPAMTARTMHIHD